MPDIIPVVPGLPAYLQQVQYVPTNLGAGITASAPRLGLTITREFTFTKNGQTQILPPDATGRRVVRAVILAAAPTLNKAWFSKAYAPGTDAVPDCYSDDAQVPAPAAEHKQHTQCGSCPKNAFGSNPVTGRGKACADRKRLVLALESDPKEAVVTNWPTMSLGGLKNLEMQLEQGRIPLQSLMLEFSFDMSVIYSKVLINPVGFVPEEVFRALKELADLPSTQELLRAAVFDNEGDSHAQPAVPGAVPAYVQQGYGPAAGAQAAPTPTQPVPAAATPEQATQAPVPTPPPAVPAAEAPKRKRRTKAEMEAARAAEAAGQAQVAPAPVQAAAAPAAEPQAQPAVPPGVDPAQFAAFQAFQAQKAATAQQGQAVHVPLQGQLLPAETQAPQQAAANVMDLINKWKKP